MPLWTNNGKLVSSVGVAALLDCDDCPCDEGSGSFVSCGVPSCNSRFPLDVSVDMGTGWTANFPPYTSSYSSLFEGRIYALTTSGCEARASDTVSITDSGKTFTWGLCLWYISRVAGNNLGASFPCAGPTTNLPGEYVIPSSGWYLFINSWFQQGVGIREAQWTGIWKSGNCNINPRVKTLQRVESIYIGGTSPETPPETIQVTT